MLKTITLFLALLFPIAALAVDANSASEIELDQLRGIRGLGSPIAAKIVFEREKNGHYKNWDDLIGRITGLGNTSAEMLSRGGLTVNGTSFNRAESEQALQTNAYSCSSIAKNGMPGYTRVEMRFKPVPEWVNKFAVRPSVGTNAYHSYLVITDQDGSQTYFRAGPSLPYLRAEYGPYNSATPDWTDQPCSNYPIILILAKMPARGIIEKLAQFNEKLNSKRILYQFAGTLAPVISPSERVADGLLTSNSYIYSAIEELKLPKKAPPVFAPGWGNSLAKAMQ
jgi:competence protein ComEA